MAEVSESTKEPRSFLFLFAGTFVVLAMVLFFAWIYKLNRDPVTSPSLVAKPLVNVQGSDEAAPEGAAPVPELAAQLPPRTEKDPPPGAEKLANTQFVIIRRPVLKEGDLQEGADIIPFEVNGVVVRIRLQGIDALIPGNGDPTQRARQAALCHTSPEDIGAKGETARDGVFGLLKQHNFTLITNWQPAGSGQFFGNIFVEMEDGNWSFLTELLLARGEAFLNNQPMIPPLQVASAESFLARHRDCQAHAMKLTLGAWKPGAK